MIVVTLTGLIWFFADQAGKDSKMIKVLVKVQPAGTVVVLGQDPQILEFDVTVSAPRVVISEIEKETQGQALRGVLPLDENVGTGEQLFKADVALAKLDVVQKRGLAISAVKPDSFTLTIDKIVRRSGIRIKPQFPGLEVDAEEVSPSTCSVSLPSQLAAQLEQAGDVLTVDASSYVDLTQPGTGTSTTKTVTLHWPTAVSGAEKYVSFEPAAFNLKYRLKDKTGARKFESVQVDYKVMPDIEEKYRIERPDKSEWRPTIIVSGPKQRVDSLQKDEVMLLVKILPSDEDSVGKRVRRSVSVLLPPGIQLEGTPPEVQFILQDRAAVVSTTGG